MSPPHDWYVQMPYPSLDDTTADRILLGAAEPDDAAPGYAGLAALVRHVTEPAVPSELAAQGSVVEAMLEASVTPDKRRTLPKRVFTAKAVTIAAVATFGLGSAAAAAAGALPGQSHHSPRPSPPPVSVVPSHDPAKSTSTIGTGRAAPASTGHSAEAAELNLSPRDTAGDVVQSDGPPASASDAAPGEATTLSATTPAAESGGDTKDQPAASSLPPTAPDETSPTTAASGTPDASSTGPDATQQVQTDAASDPSTGNVG